MKRQEEEFLKESMKKIDSRIALGQEDKLEIMKNAMQTGRQQAEEESKIMELLFQYPWQIAFGGAMVQTACGLLLFGLKYAGFIWNFMGGIK